MSSLRVCMFTVLLTIGLLFSMSAAWGQAPAAGGSPAAPVASGKALLEEAIGLTGEVMFIDSRSPGMLLIVVRGQDAVIQGYGETAKGNGHQPDGKSLFRLGSITKTFAGYVLASLASEGKVRLTDPLRLYAPGVVVPQYDGREITLLDLATHSAGLPREASDFAFKAPPFTAPTREQRWVWLPKYQLQWEPGKVAAYSNIGFDLLVDALAASSRKSYAELLQEQVTGPLGMKDTGLSPTPEQCQRLMLGSGIGGPGPCVDTTATAGSGGLYSTANDMLLWLKYNLSSDPKKWQALALAHAAYLQRQALKAAIGFDEAGPMGGLGLPWVMVPADGIRPMLLEKSGGGGGFMTYIAFAPGRNVAVFWVVNRVDFGMFYGLANAANDLIANLVTR